MPQMDVDLWQTPAGRRLRMQCWRRDRESNPNCWWCKKPIDYSLGPYRRGGDTSAWSPDHRRPRRYWPQLALEPSNIVAAHFRCNASRGTKAAVEEMGTPTREW